MTGRMKCQFSIPRAIWAIFRVALFLAGRTSMKATVQELEHELQSARYETQLQKTRCAKLKSLLLDKVIHTESNALVNEPLVRVRLHEIVMSLLPEEREMLFPDWPVKE